ncbi:HAD-IA family hydrolase [Streptacidiphilus rugosus]|uniref:HAD-IA family hydrolase n=1 Tax=Streptacidiphilus rugosus TaxID=405783 RepID=UPI0005698C5A|nr:HAD-IA family hydrolase [Streptacidiphilus rugosus]
MADLAFDAVLCDLDGVVRFYRDEEIARLEREAGIEPGATARIAFAPEQDLPLLLGRISREEWADSIAAVLRERMTGPESGRPARELARAFAYAPSWADAEAVALLRRARERVPVLLVTNATVWLDEDLACLGLDDLADHVVNSSVVGVAKPDEAIYRLAARRAGAAPERCLFVDDSEVNVEAARTLGMTAVLHRETADLRRALEPILRAADRADRPGR